MKRNMTQLEQGTRSALAKYLRSQGYVTYAGLLLHANLNFYRPLPGEIFAAAMEPGKNRILINPAITDKDALSVFIRHEILHEFLKHFDRALNHMAKLAGLDPDVLDDESLNEFAKKLKTDKGLHDIFNIAADYEIANRGYTENDKIITRNLGHYLNLTDDLADQAEFIRGLVTEDDHPDWINLPLEDMFDLLQKEREKDKKDMPPGGDPPPTSPDGDPIDDTEEGDGPGTGPGGDPGDKSKPTGDSPHKDPGDKPGPPGDGPGGDPGDDGEEEGDSPSGGPGDPGDMPRKKPSHKGGSHGDPGDESEEGETGEGSEEGGDLGDPGDPGDDGEEGGGSGSPWSNYDKEELAKQDKEREEEIAKELEELEDIDPYSSEAKGKLEEIADLLADESFADSLFDETDRVVRVSRKEKREREKAARKEAEKYTAKDGIDNFVLDLNKLVKSEVKKIKKKDWGKYNVKADSAGLVKPGKSRQKNPMIPKLYVYFDQSGSWDENDIEIGKQAIATLNTFVEKKQLVINLFYFGQRLTTTPGYAANGPRWECFDKVAEHIKQYRPDNVVIMTDSDGDHFDQYTGIYSMNPVTVPGGMFLLFRRGEVSKQVVRVFKGKKVSKIYKF